MRSSFTSLEDTRPTCPPHRQHLRKHGPRSLRARWSTIEPLDAPGWGPKPSPRSLGPTTFYIIKFSGWARWPRSSPRCAHPVPHTPSRAQQQPHPHVGLAPHARAALRPARSSMPPPHSRRCGCDSRAGGATPTPTPPTPIPTPLTPSSAPSPPPPSPSPSPPPPAASRRPRLPSSPPFVPPIRGRRRFHRRTAAHGRLRPRYRRHRHWLRRRHRCSRRRGCKGERGRAGGSVGRGAGAGQGRGPQGSIWPATCRMADWFTSLSAYSF